MRNKVKSDSQSEQQLQLHNSRKVRYRKIAEKVNEKRKRIIGLRGNSEITLA
jgi:hypothetical protein